MNKAYKAQCKQCPYKNNKIIQPKLNNAADVTFITDTYKPHTQTVLTHLQKVAQYNKPINITQLVLCTPNGKNRRQHAKAIECCLPRLKHELDVLHSTTLCTLGNTATNTVVTKLLNHHTPVNLNKNHGQWIREYCIDLLPTFDIDYVFNKPDEFRKFSFDVKKAFNGFKYYGCMKEPIIHQPLTYDELERALTHIPTNASVVVDIEADSLTYYETTLQTYVPRILQIGIAWNDSEAIIINHALIYGELIIDVVYPNKHNNFFIDETNLYYEEETNDYPGFYHNPDDCKKLIQQFFNRNDITFIAHNGKYDINFLRSVGLTFDIEFDTLLAHYVLNELTGTHKLKVLAKDYFDIEYEDILVNKYLTATNKTYSQIPLKDLTIYCAWDCTITWTLFNIFRRDLLQQHLYDKPFKSLIMPMHKLFTNSEYYGIPIDIEHLTYWKKQIEDTLDELNNAMVTLAEDTIEQFKINTPVKYSQLLTKVDLDLTNKSKVYTTTVKKLLLGESGFNPKSVWMVSTLLYDIIKIPKVKAYGIKPRSTSKQAILRLIEKYSKVANVPFIKLLQQHRRISKIYSSYILVLLNNVDNNGYVHANIQIHGTEIGRISIKEPAMQTIPRPYADIFGAIIRSSITAKPGKVLIDADFSQAELRVAAVLSNDAFLLDIYKTGRDLHSETAKELFGEQFNKEQRTWCKNLNFSDLYGGNAYSFASQANLPLEKASKVVMDRQQLMPELTKWKKQNFITLKTTGKIVNPFGRVRRFPFINSKNENEARKSCTHMLVSSTASDLNTLAAIELRKKGVDVILLVHDSIIAEEDIEQAEETKKLIEQTMLEIAYKYFPIIEWSVDADIVNSWSPKPFILLDDNLTLQQLKNDLDKPNLELPITLNESYQGKNNYFSNLIEKLGIIQLWSHDTLKINLD